MTDPDTTSRLPDPDTASRLPDPDRAYRMLIDAHRGLSEEESAALNTRLVLVLANALGDTDRLARALALARRSDSSRPADCAPSGNG